MVRSGKAPRNLARAKGVGTAASTSRLSVPRPVSPLPRPHPKMCSVSSPFSEGCSSALLIGAARGAEDPARPSRPAC